MVWSLSLPTKLKWKLFMYFCCYVTEKMYMDVYTFKCKYTFGNYFYLPVLGVWYVVKVVFQRLKQHGCEAAVTVAIRKEHNSQLDLDLVASHTCTNPTSGLGNLRWAISPHTAIIHSTWFYGPAEWNLNNFSKDLSVFWGLHELHLTIFSMLKPTRRFFSY